MAYNKVDYGGKTLIDLTGDTVTPATLAKGETAHDMTGAQIVGTMEGGGGNTLHITFSTSLAGCAFTVTNGDETITGTVPDDCVIDVAVSGAGTYTVECEGASADVEVKDVFDVEVLKLEYFAVYSADDSSLTFYGGDTVPNAGTQYNGKTATTIYTGLESMGTSSNPPWYSDRTSFVSVLFDASFAGCKPTSCRNWFYGMTKCTAIDGLKHFNTSSVTTMYGMFYNCSGLTSLDLSNLDTSSVTTMYQMFYNCSGLTSLDVSNWDTAKVTNMYQTFRGCSGLTSLDVSGWDTAKVTNMSYMFYSCSGLTSLDVSNFDTSNVTNMSSMFQNCSKITSLDVSNFDTSNVTNMNSMFQNCSGLTSLDVSNFDTSNVTNMSSMFYSCSNLTTIYSNDSNFVTTAVTSGGSMFSSCSKLVGGNGTAYSSSNVTYTMAHIDTASNPGYFTDVNDKE